MYMYVYRVQIHEHILYSTGNDDDAKASVASMSRQVDGLSSDNFLIMFEQGGGAIWIPCAVKATNKGVQVGVMHVQTTLIHIAT